MLKQLIKKYWYVFLLSIFAAFLFFYKSREGFQIPASVETPATCNMMKVIKEKLVNQLASVKASGYEAQIPTITTTIESINAEILKMNCPA